MTLAMAALLVGAAIGTALAMGSEYQTLETEAAQAALARARRLDPMTAPGDGYGLDGRPLAAPHT